MKTFLTIGFIILLSSCNSEPKSEETYVSKTMEMEMVSTDARSQDAPKYTDLSVAEFKEKMAEEGVIVLDVRTPSETAKGKIGEASEADFLDKENFAAAVAELDKSRTYLIYCASGGRSARACKMMAEAGFEKLYNLDGGYKAWQAAASE